MRVWRLALGGSGGSKAKDDRARRAGALRNHTLTLAKIDRGKGGKLCYHMPVRNRRASGLRALYPIGSCLSG
jgi:hypothetical protein